MSTLASPLGFKPKNLLTRKGILWSVMFFMTTTVFLTAELPFLDPGNPARAHHYQTRWVLLPHILFASIALLAGPFQFSSRIRRQYPRFHRILGRTYVASIMIAAPMGILIPIVGPIDPFFTAGIMIHGTSWFICTLMAFLTARNRHIQQHKQWMVRSYVVTFSFILTRALGPIWGAFHINITEYGMVDATLNVLYLLVSDIALNWREITTARA